MKNRIKKYLGNQPEIKAAAALVLGLTFEDSLSAQFDGLKDKEYELPEDVYEEFMAFTQEYFNGDVKAALEDCIEEYLKKRKDQS